MHIQPLTIESVYGLSDYSIRFDEMGNESIQAIAKKPADIHKHPVIP